MKQFLRRYTYANKEIDRKLEEIARLRERVTRINVAPDNIRVQTSPHDHVGDAIAKIVDMEREINEQINQLRAIKLEIEAAIGAVEDERLQLLLRYRYIDGMTWEEIAVKMNYTYRNVTILHGRALEQIKHFLVFPI